MPVLPALVSTDDLAARVGPIPDSEQARAASCIADATALVVAEVGAKALAWTADVVPVEVPAVILAAAGRVYRNPEGLVSQTVGPLSESRSPTSVSAYLTEYERQLVRRAAGKSGLATVRVTREDPMWTGLYLPVYGSDEQVQWFPEEGVP